jgi:hypothetical protein
VPPENQSSYSYPAQKRVQDWPMEAIYKAFFASVELVSDQCVRVGARRRSRPQGVIDLEGRGFYMELSLIEW